MKRNAQKTPPKKTRKKRKGSKVPQSQAAPQPTEEDIGDIQIKEHIWQSKQPENAWTMMQGGKFSIGAPAETEVPKKKRGRRRKDADGNEICSSPEPAPHPDNKFPLDPVY